LGRLLNKFDGRLPVRLLRPKPIIRSEDMVTLAEGKEPESMFPVRSMSCNEEMLKIAEGMEPERPV
jgi:hypothetical protein